MENIIVYAQCASSYRVEVFFPERWLEMDVAGMYISHVPGVF